MSFSLMPNSHLTIYLVPYLFLEPDMLWRVPSHAVHPLACNPLCSHNDRRSCVLITLQFASLTDPIDPMALMSRTLSHGQPIGFLVRPPRFVLSHWLVNASLYNSPHSLLLSELRRPLSFELYLFCGDAWALVWRCFGYLSLDVRHSLYALLNSPLSALDAPVTLNSLLLQSRHLLTATRAGPLHSLSHSKRRTVCPHYPPPPCLSLLRVL